MKKWVLTVIAVLSLAAVLIGGNWAWLVDKTGPLTNRFTAGTVRVEINEHGFTDVSGWSSGVAAEKKISAKSKGSKASYVRISLTPVWGTETGGVFTAEPSLPVDNVQFNFADGYDSNWVYQDGWYYYRSILAGGAETGLLLQSVTLISPMGEEYKGKVLHIMVNAESVQASHGVYREAWDMENLPQGVEAWIAPQTPSD